MVLVLVACAHPPPAPASTAAAPTSPPLSAEARAFYLRAEVAHALGDAAEAERAAAWVPRLDGEAWAQVRVSDLARRGGRLEDARAAAERALALAPTLPEAHRVAGLARLAAGDAAGAVPHLERAAGLAGVDAARVRALRDAGGDALGALLAWSPATAAGRLERSAAALELGQPDEALADALALLDHPVLGPDALLAAVATCRLAAVDARMTGIVAEAGWDAALAALAAARATCAERG